MLNFTNIIWGGKTQKSIEFRPRWNLCWLKASMMFTLVGDYEWNWTLRATSEELVMFCILIWALIIWICSDVKTDLAILCLCIFLHVCCYTSIKKTQKKKFIDNIYNKTKWQCVPMKFKKQVREEHHNHKIN